MVCEREEEEEEEDCGCVRRRRRRRRRRVGCIGVEQKNRMEGDREQRRMHREIDKRRRSSLEKENRQTCV